jgi:DsbC/DsbD-like thiol-disulfide interchange protein
VNVNTLGTIIMAMAAVATSVATAGQSSTPQAPNPVRWTVQSPPESVAAGQTVIIKLAAQIDEGWHLYALEQTKGGPIATKLSVSPDPPFALQVKAIDKPDPQVTHDPNFGMDTSFYDGAVVFGLPVKVAANLAAGEREISLNAYFQACNDRICLRPTTTTTKIKVKVRPRS